MRQRNKILSAPYLVWMAAFIIVPLAVVLYFALTDNRTGTFTFNNILNIKDYLPMFLDSIWMGAAAAIICLLIGYPVAYTIARAPASRQRFYVLLIMLPMCMSFLLLTISWVSILEDTGYINRFLSSLGIGPLKLIRTRPAVILGMVYNYLPYMILPLHSVLVKINPLFIEAAQDLGCDDKTVLRKITLPLSLPGIVSGITMVFVPAVSTFYITKKLGGPGSAMIGDVIESQFKTSYNPNLGAAMSLVLMILILICMSLMNRFTGDDEDSVLV